MRSWSAGFVMILLLMASASSSGQSIEYRATIVDEGSYLDPNVTTPLNWSNSLLPQAYWSNIGTAALALSTGIVAGTFGLSTSTTNRVGPSYAASIHELSADISLSDNVNLLIGKKILKWGTGYAFNPTGVIEPQRSPSDPTDRLSQNDGRTLVSLTAYSRTSSFTFVYVNDAVISTRAFQWGAQEAAVRAYFFLNGLDLSLVGHYREFDRLQIGGNGSYVIGDNLELHAEFLGQRGSSLKIHPIILTDNASQVFLSDPTAPLFDRSSKLFLKMLLGGQYTFDNGINVILEYYHNDEGLSGKEWQRWMNFVTFHNAVLQGTTAVDESLQPLSRANLYWALSTLSPRGTLRDYIFARGSWSDEPWNTEAIAFIDIDDGGSLTVVPTLSWQVSKFASIYTRAAAYFGGRGTEFGSLFTKSSLTIGFQIQV